MTRIVKTTVYTFDELSDAAREKARDWYREALAEYQRVRAPAFFHALELDYATARNP
jgi:hypothetical protein